MKAKEMSGLYLFCQAVEYGGYAAAALHTKVSAPTLSRAVSQLEDKLGEKLVHRNAKQFRLTTAGDEYYKRFSPIFSQLNEQWLQLSNNQPTLTGDIYISCPEPFADYFLQQLAIEFMAEHPDVNIHILFASDTERFFEDRIDLAVVTSPPTASYLVQRRLFRSELCLAAAPQYVQKYGEPRSVQDLLEHNLLAGNTLPVWEFKEKGKSVRIPLNPKYSIDSLRLNTQAAVNGLGIALIPKVSLIQHQEQNRLVQLLPDIECPYGEAYLVWSDRKLTPVRVNAFKEMIFDRFDQKHSLLTSVTQLD